MNSTYGELFKHITSKIDHATNALAITDPSTREAKLFRRRFRVPWPIY
jgi:hypothetical protein